MLIEQRIWDAAQDIIFQEKDAKTNRLKSGNCTPEEYSRLCGYLQGMAFYERALKEAKNPPKPQPDEED